MKYAITLAASLALALPLGAQQSRYATRASDTLRYIEETRATVTTRTSQGSVEMRTEHDATVALIFTSGDTARAWYEQLRLLSAGGPASDAPDTKAMLGRPYTLAFSPRGAVTLVSAPGMPAEIASMTDLTHQFDDFFISLPAGRLTHGVEWVDTVRSDRAGRPTDTYEAEAVRRFRVERDTVVAGENAVIISVRSRFRLAGSSQLEAQRMTVSTDLEGEDTGFVVFAPASGRMLSRLREGSLTGELRATRSAAPIVMPQAYRYTSTIRIQR